MIINKIIDNYGIGEIYYYSTTFYITCNFEFLSTSNTNDIIIASHFVIYDNNDDEISLKNTVYASEVWKAIFDIKKIHYDLYKPAIIEIEIPFEYTSKRRINNYLTRLSDICGDTGDVFKYQHYIYYGTIPNIDIYKDNRLDIVEKMKHILSYKKFINLFK